MVLSDKDPSRMPLDLPDRIPGSGTGTGYGPPLEDEDVDLGSSYSMVSTANDLVYEHGRRFPNYRYGTSPIPRGDKLGRENEEWIHSLILLLLDRRLYIAPIKQPRNVLDVKCGFSGLWAKNMADMYPDCQVTGTDISMVDAEGRQNCYFVIQSYTDDWIFDEVLQANGKFDLIYARHLAASSNDFPRFYKQCYDNLEPGGYLEQFEFVASPRCDDNCFRSDSVLVQVMEMLPELEKNTGTDYHLATRMRHLVADAGFVDIREEITKLPWTPWPTPGTKYHAIGEHTRQCFRTGFQGWVLLPMIRMGYTLEQINAKVEAVFQEMRDGDQHFYFQSIMLTARKPIDAPS